MQWTKVGKSSWSNRQSAGWGGVKDHFYQHSGNHWRLQARAPCFQHIYYYSNVITKLIGLCQRHFVFPARPLAHLPFSACPQLRLRQQDQLEEMFKEARKQCPVRECGGWGSPCRNAFFACIMHVLLVWIVFMSLCMHVRNSPLLFLVNGCKVQTFCQHKLHYNYDSLQLHGKRGSNTLSPWSRVRPWDPHGPYL